MCRPALWSTEMEPSSTSFSEQFVDALCSTDLSREFTLKGGQAQSLHNVHEHSGELTPDMNSVFHLRLPLQRVLSFPSPQKQKHFTFISHSFKKCHLSAPQPRQTRGQAALSTAHQHQHFLGTILWGRTNGEKEMRDKLTWSGSHT